MGRLFWKIFAGFWLTLILTSSIVGLLVWQHNKERIEQLEILVNGPKADISVNYLASLLASEGTPALEDYIGQSNRRHRRPFPIFMVNDNGIDLLGRPVSDTMLHMAREALKDPQQSAILQVRTPQGERFILFIPRNKHRGMRHNKFFPPGLPLSPLLIFIISSLLFSAGLAWYITRPIRYLREATRHFADGKLDTRVMSNIGSRQDEITDLAKDFDLMAEQVQQLVEAQKRLLNDVSHELRSPLARLQVAVEIGRQQPEKINELLLRVEKESQRLDELVGELLTLSRLEVGVSNNETDYFDISGLVESIANDARFESETGNKKIIFDPNDEILINGSMELLRRAIENVVRNAVYYTPQDSQVTITLSQDNELINITVCDCGKGVSEDKLAQLFLPFVRINENQQNIRIPGYGLGLAITRRAIEIHQGSVTAYNHKQGGLCIELRLPV